MKTGRAVNAVIPGAALGCEGADVSRRCLTDAAQVAQNIADCGRAAAAGINGRSRRTSVLIAVRNTRIVGLQVDVQVADADCRLFV